MEWDNHERILEERGKKKKKNKNDEVTVMVIIVEFFLQLLFSKEYTLP